MCGPVVIELSDAGVIAAAGVLGLGLGLGLVIGAVVIRWLLRLSREDESC